MSCIAFVLAGGYVGGRLAPLLLDAGHTLRCLVRDARRLQGRPRSDQVEVVEGDATRPEALPESYSRYLLNSLREAFDLHAVPLRLHFRRGDNPYARSR